MEGESYRIYNYRELLGPARRAWSGARAGWERSRPSRSRLREASEISRVLRGAQLARLFDDIPAVEEIDLGLCFFGSDAPHISVGELIRLYNKYVMEDQHGSR